MLRRVPTVLVAIVVAAACGGQASAPSAASAVRTSAVPASAVPGAASSAPAGPASGPGSPAPTPAAGAGGSAGPSAWPVYHRDPARSGFDPSFPALAGPLTTRWTAHLDGAVYGEPLVVGGRVIAATEGDSVYALDPASGRVAWRTNLGIPVPLATLPCGDIDPLGITSTPAFDPSTGSLFVSAEVTGPHHLLFALDPVSGRVRWSRGLDLAGDDPATHQQRSALAVGNGYVYVGLGGLYGDCGQYVGEVIGVPASGQGPTIHYRVPAVREGAVWSSGGPVLDAGGNVYVSVGNGSSTSTYDGSDSVLELSPALRLLSRFAPSTWAADNAADLDLGSLSPAPVPGGFVFIVGKSGTAYVLRQGALGGIGGEISSTPACPASGGAATSGSSVFVPCQSGLVRADVGGGGAIRLVWRTSAGANGPPVIGGGAVWSLDLPAGVLDELDPATGRLVASVGVGPVPHFASPTLWSGAVLVGTMTGVVEVGGA